MKWIRGSSVAWALVGLGLLTTSCAGAIGAGAAAVVVGAGVLAMTCYDRVAITVVDQLTGMKLCDAKVTFTEGSSVTEASSCYTAALTTGKYMLKVERQGLLPYEVPVEVNTGSKCRHAVQTIYVAMERPGRQKGTQVIGPPAPLPATPAPAAPPASAPAAPTAPAAPGAAPPAGSVTPPGAPPPTTATPPASATPPAPPPPPAGSPAPPAAPAPAAPPPAATSFPNP